MKIRPYRESDRENVRFVCLNSDGPCRAGKRRQNFLLTTYCDYFIEKEGRNVFVATDENDKAIGYILCAENYDNFKEIFYNEYIERLGKWEFKFRKSAMRSTLIQEEYKKEYPAHLHIDILPDFQRMGLGHKLMDALCENLKSKNIKGVCLTVWAGNKKGRRFYEKYGFTLLETRKTTAVYGLKLSEKEM